MTIQIRLPKRHPGQLDVLRSAARFNVLCCGRRWGKSVLAEDRAIDGMLRGWPVGWFAPSYKYLDTEFSDIAAALGPLSPDVNKTSRTIQIITGGSLECWTARDEDAGRNRKYGRVIINEAAKIAALEKIWSLAIRPTLTDLAGDAWFLSTPRGYDFFHQLTEGAPTRDGWASWRLPTSDNPHIDPDEIEAARRDLAPWIFAQEYEAMPAAHDEDACIPLAWVLAARDADYDPEGAAVIGLDVGDGVDETVAAVRRGPVVCQLHTWTDQNTTQSTHRVMTLAVAESVPTVVYDLGAVGSGVRGVLDSEPHNLDHRGESTGSSASRAPLPDDPRTPSSERFANRKSELWWSLRLRFERTWEDQEGVRSHDPQDCIRIPSDMLLISQLTQPRYAYRNGRIRVESNDDQRRRGLKSPDRADAVTFAFADHRPSGQTAMAGSVRIVPRRTAVW